MAEVKNTRIRVHHVGGSVFYYPECKVKGIIFNSWQPIVLRDGRAMCYVDIHLAKEAIDNYLFTFELGENPSVERAEFIDYP